MKVAFSKYSGLGNDFILLDNRSKIIPSDNPLLFKSLCHRQQGIGADGVILLEDHLSADCAMRIFNSDGTEAEMCGNGIRCLAKFLKVLGFEGSSHTIKTMHRLIEVSCLDEKVLARMGSPTTIRWNKRISLDHEEYEYHHLDTGVPHVIIFVDNIDNIEVKQLGRRLRFHPYFEPRGANINFVAVDSIDTLSIRTYERGVEEETLACGTGATASALAYAHEQNIKGPITVKVKNGDYLEIGYSTKGGDFFDVSMTGPAINIFEGIIEI